jgi:hypothetical protein
MFCGFQFQGRSSPIRLTAPLSVADRLLSGLSGMAQEHRSFSAIPTTRPARCATESTSSSIFGASERPSCRLGSCVRFFVPKILRLSLIANGWTADAATVPALRPAGSNRQQRCQFGHLCLLDFSPIACRVKRCAQKFRIRLEAMATICHVPPWPWPESTVRPRRVRA